MEGASGCDGAESEADSILARTGMTGMTTTRARTTTAMGQEVPVESAVEGEGDDGDLMP